MNNTFETKTGNMGIKAKWYEGLIISDKKQIYDHLFTNMPFLSALTIHSFKNGYDYYIEYNHYTKYWDLNDKFIDLLKAHLKELNVTIEEVENELNNNVCYMHCYYLHKGLYIKVTINRPLGNISFDCYYERRKF
jgi:hypothetical protein